MTNVVRFHDVHIVGQQFEDPDGHLTRGVACHAAIAIALSIDSTTALVLN